MRRHLSFFLFFFAISSVSQILDLQIVNINKFRPLLHPHRHRENIKISKD